MTNAVTGRGAYTFALTERFPWLRCGVSTTVHGNMSYSAEGREIVQPRRQAFLQEIGLDVPAIPPYVVAPIMLHGDHIIDVPAGGIKHLPRCDVLLTRSSVVLLQTLADCLGMAFVHPQTRTIALAHSGWRGTGLHVPTKTVAHFSGVYGIDPSELYVMMGPASRGADGLGVPMEERRDELNTPIWNPYVIPGEDGGIRLQWARWAYEQLLAAGIPEGNIERCPDDTRSNPLYFSHSRWYAGGEQGMDGRHAMAIGVVG